ncbi:GumC domain-containing protein [Mucilaginibacter psychrotolerans]|uniref:Lipopolysaccharide biosynthesis protein n=1 Tax=Mucilaginibacter psychrotolerans TaxID=1524096 RepID=A0A4Y8SAZ0_9SPHI|nr:lipopolysaccharide biosynthesis protein [Mucilaginibacter psychrotolerans]TFF35536.1 lipopolysaccharide biosynthesis protein [Mucilaginibacter psychrotolerans]
MEGKPVSAQMEVQENEISLKDLVGYLKGEVKYLKSRWLVILGIGVVAALLGFAYALVKKTTYTAISTFVLEDGSKGGGLGQYAGLASLAGIDIGGGGGGGIFQGDNILELYKSRLMIEKTLLTPVVIDGKQQLLIDRYITSNNLLEKWKKGDNISTITFTGSPGNFSRKQDSIITDLTNKFNEKMLSVVKLDKKLSIIKVEVSTTDELFSKVFNSKLVETVNNFYAQTKTKKSYQNVQVLQKQADSVKNVLGSAITGVASAMDAAPNANPAMSTLRVPSQKRQVDVQASSAIYSEIVKNLEISKIALRQETPLIQVIDEPVLPLPASKVSKLKGMLMGFILGVVIVSLFLVGKRVIKQIMA